MLCSVAAAAATVEDGYPIHSLHAYFILAGDSRKEILFEVERTRDGGSFKTRSCKVKQDGKTLFLAQMSFHRTETGVETQLELPSLIAPLVLPKIEEIDFDQCPDFSGFSHIRRHKIFKNDKWELFIVKAGEELRPAPGSMLTTESSESQSATGNKTGAEESQISGDWRVQCGFLAFLSDQGMVEQMRNNFPDANWKRNQNVSLDHAMYFHRPMEIDVFSWMYFFTETKATGLARGLSTTHVFNRKGVLLATVTQEALIRAYL